MFAYKQTLYLRAKYEQYWQRVDSNAPKVSKFVKITLFLTADFLPALATLTSIKTVSYTHLTLPTNREV